jgi:hypothetical protein
MTVPASVPVAPSPRDAVRVAVLGLQWWVVLAVFPVVHAGGPPTAALPWLALPPIVLALGVMGWLLGRTPRARALTRLALLFLMPVSLAAALASLTVLSARALWSPATLAVGALSTLAYGAAAADAAGRTRALRTSRVERLATPLVEIDPRRRTWLRRSVLAVLMGGGLAAAVLAPAIGGRRALHGSWGDAGAEGTVLASVVGTAAAAFGIAALFAPRLRAVRAGEGERPRAVRVGLALVAAAALLGAYFLLRAIEARHAALPVAHALLQ